MNFIKATYHEIKRRVNWKAVIIAILIILLVVAIDIYLMVNTLKEQR